MGPAQVPQGHTPALPFKNYLRCHGDEAPILDYVSASSSVTGRPHSLGQVQPCTGEHFEGNKAAGEGVWRSGLGTDWDACIPYVSAWAEPWLCSFFQLPARADPGRQRRWLGMLDPCYPCGGSRLSRSSWTWPGLVSDMVGIRGVNQQLGDRYLSTSVSQIHNF